jgi:parvulin-like peptidyl-prolyl isomerase
MAKRDNTPPTQTRRQRAISRKEQEQQRWIYIGLGVLIAVIVVILGFGLYQTYVLEPNEPIATVNNTNITTREYQNRVKYERFMLDQAIYQTEAQRQSLLQSENEQMVEFFLGQYEQQLAQYQQQRNLVDINTLDLLIEDELIAEAAAQRGITVTDEEVTEEINRFVARQLGGLTQAAATETETARIDATSTAAMWTPTPTLTPSPTLTTTEEITPTATPADTPVPAPTATLNVVGGTELENQLATWLEILADQVGINEAQYRDIVRAVLLREKVREAVVDEVPRVAEQTHARHILVETEEEANEVIARLEAGEDFAELAAEVSQDPGSGAAGGDLGFVPRGRFVPEFDEVVFSAPVGQVSDPVQTQFGWHIIEVLEREERELNPSDYSYSQQQAWQDWLDEARLNADIEDFWTPEKAPEDPGLSGGVQVPQ